MKEWNVCVWKDPTHHTHVWNCQRIKQNFQKLVTVNRIIIVSYKTNGVCRWGQKVSEAHWVAFSWQSWQRWWDIQRESRATSQNSDTSSHFSNRWHALGNKSTMCESAGPLPDNWVAQFSFSAHDPKRQKSWWPVSLLSTAEQLMCWSLETHEVG